MNTPTTPADETPNLQAAQEREAEELARLGKEPTRPWREIKLDWQGLLDAVAENKDQDLLIERRTPPGINHVRRIPVQLTTLEAKS